LNLFFLLRRNQERKGKNKMKILKFTLFFMAFTSLCFAQPSRDGINESIYRLQAKKEIGVTYYEYTKAVQDLTYQFHKYAKEFDKYFDNGESISTKRKIEFEIYLLYLSIHLSHRCALTTWDYKNASRSEWMLLEKADSFWVEQIKKYPGMDTKENKKVVGSKKRAKMYVRTDAIIQMFWLDVTEAIEKLEKLEELEKGE
jgi:hypothetical protein